MSTRGEMSPPRRRRRTSSPPASLPDDEDLLQEILLRLPPRPSSLPRASLVCKLWRRLVAEPQFQRRFRDHHHGKPPLLGFFLQDNISCPFVPMLDPPDRIPGAHFSMPPHKRYRIMDCRHGLVLFRSQRRSPRLLVWDPVAREKRRLIFPPELDNGEMCIINGAVLRPARGRSSIAQDKEYTRVSGCLFSSETGVWSNIKTLQLDLANRCMPQPSTLIGNSICWLDTVHHDHPQYAILEFDLDTQSLSVTELPPHLEAGYDQLRIIKPGEDGGLGFIHLSHFHAQIWKRKPDCNGLAVWVIDRAIEFKELRSNCKGYSLTLVGFVEESNAILVLTASGVFMVYPQPMEFKKLSKLWVFCLYYPFASFYPAAPDA
ncbi:hypothetical protein CFC21_037761 [Triticum aestivum]|uniref:Uncharacterized protein n=2 Tax=Triticum aestivum TaxID=4565 RepID=A0A3B6ET81_WHEAT|nr:hypothetical protein CFC21_037761 [Triticum aestivum]